MYMYTIKVEAGEGCNQEFVPDEELREGVNVDGFALLGLRNGRPGVVVLYGVTTMELATVIGTDASEGGSVIRQAAAIAEGIRKAKEIKQTDDRDRNAGELIRKLFRN